MQDGEFLDREAPHPIGQAIFVFAGGTSATFREFSGHAGLSSDRFKKLKGPDFLSRLRATLDIPSLNTLVAEEPDSDGVQRAGTYDPYGPVELFPCDKAIHLRRAAILAFNLSKKEPMLKRADGSLSIKPEVLRVLLSLPEFEHGNRSFEALLDMSHIAGATEFSASLLPPPFQVSLHADESQLEQLLITEYPLDPEHRLRIAKAIHADFRNRVKKKRKSDDPANCAWDLLPEKLKASNLRQANDIAIKLRMVGLWLRKISPTTAGGTPDARLRSKEYLKEFTIKLAKAEHDRWVAEKRQSGWVAGADTSSASKINELLVHNCLFPWRYLTEEQKALDLDAVKNIPLYLTAAGYEVILGRGSAIRPVPGSQTDTTPVEPVGGEDEAEEELT